MKPSPLCSLPDESLEVKGIPRLISPLLRSVLVLFKKKKRLCLLKGMPQANVAANLPPRLSVTFSIPYWMASFCFGSTKIRLSSHPAEWGRVVKVGDSDGGSMDEYFRNRQCGAEWIFCHLLSDEKIYFAPQCT